MGNSAKIGKLGEDLAVRFLESKGFHVKHRNYRKIFGELDIVAEKKGKVHFVEVKTLSYETGDSSVYKNKPEDSVHYRKRERLKRAIQGYLREYSISHETDWQFDIIAVHLNAKEKTAKVGFLRGLVLENGR